MKALSLWQPWATLVATGAKRVETRGYAPARVGLMVGQRIAIHATKTTRHLGVCYEEPFFSALVLAGYGASDTIVGLPLGAIVATARIGSYAATRRCRLDGDQLLIPAIAPDGVLRRPCDEYAFGDYAPGRYAWVLEDIEPLDVPQPFRGRQGPFPVPRHVIDAGRKT